MLTRRTPGLLTALTLPILTLTALTGLALTVQPSARADTVAANTAGTQAASGGFTGQSFTVSTSGPENNITFSFLNSASSPFATGDAFLLSSPYLGTPSALSGATTGFLGETTASGNVYTFAPGLTLQSGTRYFLYENGAFPPNSIEGGNVYSGGQSYFSTGSSVRFNSQAESNNFLVTGTSAITATPEPASYAAFAFGGLGLLGLGLKARKRSA